MTSAEEPLRFRVPDPISRRALALRLRIARTRQGMNLLGSALKRAENLSSNDEGTGHGSERNG